MVLSDDSDDFHVERKIKQEEEEQRRKKRKKEKKEKKRLKEASKEEKRQIAKSKDLNNGHHKPTKKLDSFRDRIDEDLERGESSRVLDHRPNKTNKRFLQSAIVQTVTHNDREMQRHRERSSLKLDQMDRWRERYPDEKYDVSGRHYVRNPLAHRRVRERYNYNYDRYNNARRKAERFPPREPREIKFIKPRDLDDRVLIPGQPKKARVKEIMFITPKEKEEQFLGHDATDLRMQRIRSALEDKIPRQVFVSPRNPKEKFFHLCGNRVAGLIRKASEDPPPEPKYPVIFQTPSHQWPPAFQTTTTSTSTATQPTPQNRQLVHSSWPLQQKDTWSFSTASQQESQPPVQASLPAPTEAVFQPVQPAEEPVGRANSETFSISPVDFEADQQASSTQDLQTLKNPTSTDKLSCSPAPQQSEDAPNSINLVEPENIADCPETLYEDDNSDDDTEPQFTLDEDDALLYQCEVDEDPLQAWQTLVSFGKESPTYYTEEEEYYYDEDDGVKEDEEDVKVGDEKESLTNVNEPSEGEATEEALEKAFIFVDSIAEPVISNEPVCDAAIELSTTVSQEL